MPAATRIERAKDLIRRSITDGLTAYPVLRGRMQFLLPHILDHPIASTPRYGHGKPVHPGLNAIIDAGRVSYTAILEDFARLHDAFARIPGESPDCTDAVWGNYFFTGLDAVALYGLLAHLNPRRLIEVGSGYSSRFARRAINDHGLRTSLTSIDPEPRVEIDAICDAVIRAPLESVDLSLFDSLEAGDILFIDNSHRVFMNSDACVVFMDILPRLKPGVLVHIHDIFLPADYPDAWVNRYYSEQYLLGAALLSAPGRFKTLLPNAFVMDDPSLSALVDPIFAPRHMAPYRDYLPAGSYWLELM